VFNSSFSLLYSEPLGVLGGFVLLLAIVGAFRDRSYVRARGARATMKERIYLGMLLGGGVLVLVLLGRLGWPAEEVGYASFYLTVLIFALWELNRFRIRRQDRTKSTMVEQSLRLNTDGGETTEDQPSL